MKKSIDVKATKKMDAIERSINDRCNTSGTFTLNFSEPVLASESAKCGYTFHRTAEGNVTIPAFVIRDYLHKVESTFDPEGMKWKSLDYVLSKSARVTLPYKEKPKLIHFVHEGVNPPEIVHCEVLPAGTRFDFSVSFFNDEAWDFVVMCLGYGNEIPFGFPHRGYGRFSCSMTRFDDTKTGFNLIGSEIDKEAKE